ncbi:hypothetical protein AAEO56_12805 [Flavobacterium sp. DGU11]|uniref:Uncharacterized protein n=1 Tax=Flavobacterium arundinis TaxID=3139143 RepID=A0ABU9HY99_9FLAO
MPNLKFNYLYRDSSNYKNFGNVIFANLNNIQLDVIENAIKRNLIDGEFFSAEEWRLPNLFFETQNVDDHKWHEFESLEVINENTKSSPIEKFLIRLEK